jgi:putative ABC transport system ATP-binding protein
MEIAVEVRAAERNYGSGGTSVAALKGVTLDFPVGSFTAVMGPSGSGKSTLLNAIAGLELLDAGSVLVGGMSMAGLDDDSRTKLRRDRLGLVYQDFNLLPYLTAAQNVALPLRLAGRPVDVDMVLGLLGSVGIADRANHVPSALSGGQQQRVAIARALVLDPAAVLADEPTGALDMRSASEVLDLLRSRVDHQGATVVMVTHDPVAASRADDVVFLSDGQVSGRLEHPTARSVMAELLHLTDLSSQQGLGTR